ncbi:MAG: hypothetical protein EOP56_14895 [Sphingobacteriales bacterium]|nr:MAG: hypothetical protein EOP56_14895 [Sphingobacteriales bacterium]
MRKCLLFVALLLVSQINELRAQFLFDAPDTVCAKQPIKLKSNLPQAMSHYWGFCSGYMFDAPKGESLNGSLDGPSAIEVAKDGDKYYAFIANSRTNSFVRYDFGTDLSNDNPVITDFGSMGGALPEQIGAIYVVKDEAKGNWHVFVGGGGGVGNSALARIDFGKRLDSVPNIVNFGNLQGLMAGPRGIFIAKEDDKWYGFFVNYHEAYNNLVKMEFDTSISLTPTLTDLGCFRDPATMTCEMITPTDLAAMKHADGEWVFYITNERNGYLSFLFVGKSLAAATGTSIVYKEAGNPGGALVNPSSISIIKDCDSLHLFITNRTSHDFLRLDLDNPRGFSKTPVSFSNVNGTILVPEGISRLIRDRDNIYAFVANFGDATVSRIAWQQCDDANIRYSTTWRPPTYRYDSVGLYNVYYAVNEGMPDMQTQCRQITVLPIPSIIVSNDTTICQGDTVGLTVYSATALSTTWMPNYNLSNVVEARVRAWPEYTQQYRITLPYANGCVVDTPINIRVHKIQADAGPNRTLRDGAGTLLGGPLTSLGSQYSYRWYPNQYIDNPIALNPRAKPPYDYTYYLELTDINGCKSTDTVMVYVSCEGLNLPNAFVPNSTNLTTARFGVANTNIAKLNYFKIFDRWGKEVFTSTDPVKQWDGTVNGQPAAMGVYVWEADGFCISGNRLQSKGNVTLLR